MPHRFKIGQMLELRSAPGISNRPSGVCRVLHCLPHDRGPVLYRIKADDESIERVVEEGDLSPSSAMQKAEQDFENVFSIAIQRKR